MFYNRVGFFTLMKRETRRYLKVYIQTLLGPLFSNLLFLGVFGTALQNREVGIAGVDYLSFMMPGLCIMGAIISSFSNGSSSLIIQKYTGLIQDINSYPITTTEKTAAYVLSGAIRGMIVGGATFLAGIPFVGYQLVHPILFILALFLASCFFSALGVVAGLSAKNFEFISFITTFVITPLTYFGGVFFLISSLPLVLQKVSFINPVVPMVSAIRFSYLGLGEMTDYFYNLGITLIFVFLLVYISHTCIRKGVGLVTK